MRYSILMILLLSFMVSVLMPGVAMAEYTSLLSSADFTGIAADVSTAVTGIISVALIILGASLLMRAFGR